MSSGPPPELDPRVYGAELIRAVAAEIWRRPLGRVFAAGCVTLREVRAGQVKATPEATAERIAELLRAANSEEKGD